MYSRAFCCYYPILSTVLPTLDRLLFLFKDMLFEFFECLLHRSGCRVGVASSYAFLPMPHDLVADLTLDAQVEQERSYGMSKDVRGNEFRKPSLFTNTRDDLRLPCRCLSARVSP